MPAQQCCGPSNFALRKLAVWCWLALFALSTGTAAAQPSYRFAAPASWVATADSPLDTELSGQVVTESAAILLFDRQIKVAADGDEYYQHLSTKLLNTVGVDDYSQINLVVDPTYQSLDIHWLRVIRDGVALDQQTSARITELAQETDLRNRIYNGRHNVNVLLSDVRAGDIVDYAYTIRSRDPLFTGHFYTRLDVGWSQAVAWQRIRILAPANRSLTFRASDGRVLPPPTVSNDIAEVVIESRSLAGIPADDRLPGWYSPWPFIEISDVDGWDDVVGLVEPLYTQRSRGGPLVAEVVEAIRSGGGSTDDQALRALQYVQDQIRYTSISIGRGSHEPSEPNAVVERRFGDCKDKSLLLATLLRELGIEADVALVHSWRARALDDTLPTPYAFDHAIVRARIGDAIRWLDATGATQYGAIRDDGNPRFERALVLRSGVASLETIPPPSPDGRHRDVRVVLDASKGMTEPATLEITTQYRGTLADGIRPALSRGSLDQMQTDYVAYIARYYPSARVLAPLEFDDDRADNVVEVRERYGLDSAFVANDDGILELVLHADEIYGYAEALGAGARQAPLAIEYPAHVSQTIVARLPDPWPVETHPTVVENPAFSYRSDIQYSARTLTLTYDYRARTDHVPADDVLRYERDRARMFDDLGYSLTYNKDLEGGIPTAVAPLPLLALMFALAGSIWFAVTKGYRYDPEPRLTVPEAPVGIRGWLLMPALGVLAGPFVTAGLAAQWLPLLGAAQWQTLPVLVGEVHRGYAAIVVLVFMMGVVALTVASALLMWLFFARRTSAPGLFIAINCAALLLIYGFVGWAIGVGLDDETTAATFSGEVVRDVITTILWSVYISKSRRVKATFVNRWRAPISVRPAEVTASQ